MFSNADQTPLPSLSPREGLVEEEHLRDDLCTELNTVSKRKTKRILALSWSPPSDNAWCDDNPITSAHCLPLAPPTPLQLDDGGCSVIRSSLPRDNNSCMRYITSSKFISQPHTQTSYADVVSKPQPLQFGDPSRIQMHHPALASLLKSRSFQFADDQWDCKSHTKTRPFQFTVYYYTGCGANGSQLL